MTANLKLTIAAGVVVIVLGLVALAVRDRFGTGAGDAGSRKNTRVDSQSPEQGSEQARAVSTSTWKLPFRLKPRLAPEQAAILASGKTGAYLREHPQEDDLLVAWASADPASASAWLDSVGGVEVDGTGYYYSHLSALAAGVFAHGGMAEMEALLEKHAQDPRLPPKYQDGGFDSQPWLKMAREDTGQEAIAWLQAHPGETDLAGTFLSGIDDTDRMLAALDYFQAKGIDCSPDYWQLGSRAEKDGALLADWAVGSRSELLEEVRKWIDSHASRPDLAPVLGEVRKVIGEPAR
jgi:hypothetical protein